MISGLSLLVVLTGHENSLVDQRLGSLRFVDRLPCLWRHVVLIMLCHNLISIEDTIRADSTLRDTTTSFFEKVRLNSLKNDRYAVGSISNGEVHGEAIWFFLESTVLYQTTDTECFAWRCLVRCHV